MGRSGNLALGFDDAGSNQLALWPEHLRGVPASALRSALFAPVRRGQRRAMERENIAAIGDFRIIYTGVTLDTSDLDVYEEILHRGRKHPGRAICFRTREFLGSIGRHAGKSQRDWLLKSLSRLSACELDVEKKNGKAYAGSLIQEQGRDRNAGMHYVLLAPRIATLFDQGYGLRNPDMVQAIGYAPVAKWLYGFTLGQKRALTWRIDDLEQLARSSFNRQRDFCRSIDDAVHYLGSIGHHLAIDWDRPNNRVTLKPL